MKWFDGIRIALASLIENPLRTFLTLLGIIIGVTAVIFVVSVIEGLNGYIANTFGDMGPTVFHISKFSLKQMDRDSMMRAWRRNKDLVLGDIPPIRRGAPLVDKIATKSESFGTVTAGRQFVANVSVRGVTGEMFDIENTKVELGRTFTSTENDHAVPVAFLGYDVANELFGSIDPIGRRIFTMNRTFTVIGVAQRKGAAFGQSLDNYVIVPLSVFSRIHGLHRSLDISARAVDPTRMEEAIDQVRLVLRTRHHLKPNEEDDFGIITADAVMEMWRDMTAKIFFVAIFVVSISLVVGGIVIMNIMLLSVVERTREIGVRKAIGARQEDIRFQFLSESVMLCASGGLIGVLLAWICSYLVRTFTPLPAQFPLWAPLLAVGITSVVGVFFGLHPAAKASKLDPIDALRSSET